MATYWENSCSFGLRYVSWYKYLIVSLVFSHLGFWSGNLFLIAPFPDLCLLVPLKRGGQAFCLLCFKPCNYQNTTIPSLSLETDFPIRHFSLLNVNAAGACGYDFLCDGGRLVRAYVRLRRGAI